MRIIYIHQHFMTNKGSGGTRSYDIAKYMVQAEHEVHIISGIYDTSGIEPMPWYKLFRKDNYDGINVTVCNAPYSNNMRSFKRMFSFFWFAVLGTIAALAVKKPDLVFATSTPIFVGIPGLIAAKFKKAKFIFEVRDLWPESFIIGGWATGAELYIKFMAWLENKCYAKARKILLVSEGFEKRLKERGLPPEKLKTILLGADGSIFDDVEPDYSFLTENNLEDKKIAIFTGAHGKANGLDYVIDAAEFLKKREDIKFLLIGDGGENTRLMQSVKEKGVTNIIFADPVPKQRLVRILPLCHIGLMILKHIDGGRPVTPNKIFDYMFSGIPSIVNFEGPTIDMVSADNSGVFADPLNPKDLAEKVEYLADNPDIAKQMGENGRKAALEKYDRKIIAKKLIGVFEEALVDNSN